MTMTQSKLNEILAKHKKWLNAERGGAFADLQYADLQYADLRYANLQHAQLQHAKFQHADLQCADLQYADLRGTKLLGTDLLGANLDFSCLPLWCGSLAAHFDDRQLIQIAYHLVKAGLDSKNASMETKDELSKLIDFANKFHRVDECGLIEKVS